MQLYNGNAVSITGVSGRLGKEFAFELAQCQRIDEKDKKEICSDVILYGFSDLDVVHT